MGAPRHARRRADLPSVLSRAEGAGAAALDPQPEPRGMVFSTRMAPSLAIPS